MEAGQDAAAIENIAFSELGARGPTVRAFAGSMDLHAARLEIEDLDAAHAEPEVLRHLGAHLRRTVARREDLDGKIRCDLRCAWILRFDI